MAADTGFVGPVVVCVLMGCEEDAKTRGVKAIEITIKKFDRVFIRSFF